MIAEKNVPDVAENDMPDVALPMGLQSQHLGNSSCQHWEQQYAAIRACGIMA